MKVLIIEDEFPLLQDVKNYLSKENYLVETAGDFKHAMEKIGEAEYDCVVVDINLPDGSGFEIINELKQSESKSGIIIISARNSLDDRLKGLDLGSDDYLVKPFHLSELNARIKSILRRRFHEGSNTSTFHEITLDFDSRTVIVNGKQVVFTQKEFDLLNYFIINKNRVLSQSAIVEHLWHDEMGMADSYSFIYTHVRNLRRKLADAGCGDYLKSVYGVGYKWTDQ